MWPALALCPDDLWQVHDTTPFDLAKKLSRARYLELLRGLLLEVGAPRDSAMVAGYNRLRRFLPTLGNCLQFDPIDLQAIGNWTDIPDGGGPTPTYKPKRASTPMGLHYAGQKVARSAQIKRHALECFFKLWKRKQPELATSSTLQLPAVADLPPNPDQAEGAIEVAPGALADIETTQEPHAGAESDISEYDGVSSSTSPSASDESAVGEDLVGIIPPDDIATNLPWFQQGAKIHILRANCGRRTGHPGQGHGLPEVPEQDVGASVMAMMLGLYWATEGSARWGVHGALSRHLG